MGVVDLKIADTPKCCERGWLAPPPRDTLKGVRLPSILFVSVFCSNRTSARRKPAISGRPSPAREYEAAKPQSQLTGRLRRRD